jgi:hypothetical protein
VNICRRGKSYDFPLLFLGGSYLYVEYNGGEIVYRFSGGTSFMSNGYVIWKNGLAGEDPNWLAK